MGVGGGGGGFVSSSRFKQMGLPSSFKCSMWMFLFHSRGPRVVLVVRCYFELMLLLFKVSDSKICENIKSQRGDLCEMLKKEKKIVFETIKPQKVRYISKHSFGTSVLHTRYRLLQPVLLLVVVVCFLFVVSFFRIFSVCVHTKRETFGI